jgi:hypothetical protein
MFMRLMLFGFAFVIFEVCYLYFFVTRGGKGNW